MFKRIGIIAAVGVLALVSGYANENKSTVKIPVNRVDPTNGKLMYTNYCAPCHGANARGNGPVAGALKQQPVDLTVLARSNGGKFPSDHVVSVLEFGSETPAHGSAQMPVWGPVLSKMDNTHAQDSALRIANLNRYLKSIQVN